MSGSRHALIIAGGSGTRLWPMSRARLPKQLIPFIHGKSLLEIAMDRLAGLIPSERIHICAAEAHRDLIVPLLKGGEPAGRFYGEPTGRDTLNAVGLGAAVIGHNDPDAVIAVFTADHIIEPADEFRNIVAQGYALAETQPNVLVTFGIKPTHAATGYGYLELGDEVPSPSERSERPGEGGERSEPGEGASGQSGGARADHTASTRAPSPQPSPGRGEYAAGRGSLLRLVAQFKEKPDALTAQRYADAGPDHYLWNSGMFVWRAATLMDCIHRFAPENHAGLSRLGAAWHTDARAAMLRDIYPKLKKISVDFAIMEPASRDTTDKVKVAAVPMPLSWLDVGSWPAFADTCEHDEQGNALAAGKSVLVDSKRTLVASSDPDHLITAIGCEDLIVIHTPDATLVCRADRAEDIKKLHALVGEKYGAGML